MYAYVFSVQNVILLQYLCKYTHGLLLCISVFYSFFVFPDDERREWMVVKMCKERKTISKKKIDILMKWSLQPLNDELLIITILWQFNAGALKSG